MIRADWDRVTSLRVGTELAQGMLEHPGYFDLPMFVYKWMEETEKFNNKRSMKVKTSLQSLEYFMSSPSPKVLICQSKTCLPFHCNKHPNVYNACQR